MSGNIQKVPAGLLPFLGIVGDGQAPRSLADVVAPTLDTMPFYAARSLQVVAQNTAALSAAGAGTALVVPANEWWLVFGMSVSIFAGAAAQQMAGFIGLQIPSGSNTVVMAASNSDLLSVAANDSNRCGWAGSPFLLAPSSAINGALQRNVAAGTVQVTTSALVMRLQA